MMIRAFADKRTQMVFAGENPKGFPSGILKVARRKLKIVDAAVELNDLRAPPGNQPEALSGDRKGSTFNTDQRPVARLFRMDPGGADWR
jgi:proteic killer suppression protein